MCSKGGSARIRSFTEHKLSVTQCTTQSPSLSSNSALHKTSSCYTVDDTKKRKTNVVSQQPFKLKSAMRPVFPQSMIPDKQTESCTTTNRVNQNIDFLSAEVSVRFLQQNVSMSSIHDHLKQNRIVYSCRKSRIQTVVHTQLGTQGIRTLGLATEFQYQRRSREAPIQSYKKQIPYLCSKYACP